MPSCDHEGQAVHTEDGRDLVLDDATERTNSGTALTSRHLITWDHKFCII